MDENKLNELYHAIDKINDAFNKGSATIFDIADYNKKLQQLLQELPLKEFKEFKEQFKDNTKDVVDSFDAIEKINKKKIEKEQDLVDKINKTEKELNAINNALNESSKKDAKFLEDKQKLKQKELEDLKNQHEAFITGTEEQYALRKELEDKNNKNIEESGSKLGNVLSNIAKELGSTIIDLFKGAVNKINSAYLENASSMSAALNTSVKDISKLQSDIAESLRNQSLNAALSGTEVFNKASSLVKSGFTDEDKLQNMAEDLIIGSKIAPNINFDSSQVKLFSSIFGSDFTTKFSAIQAAVQETAGYTGSLNEGLSKITTSLEPVFLNAELNNAMLQTTSDIEANIADLIANGVITESQAAQYRSYFVSMMDPGSILTNSNAPAHLKIAASRNWEKILESDDPYRESVRSVINTQNEIFSLFPTDNSAQSKFSRGIGLSSFDYTDSSFKLSSLYNPSYGKLTAEDFIKQGRSLDDIFDERLESLQEGEYTTKKAQNENLAENSEIAQKLATAEAYYPVMYSLLENKFLPLLKDLPSKMITLLIQSNLLGSIFSKAGSVITAAKTGSTLSGALASGGGSKLATLGKFGLAGGLVLGGLGATAAQWDSERSFIENVGHGGDTLSTALSYGTTGAGFGLAIGGPIGAAVGGAIGLAVGGLTAALASNKETQEKNTEATETLTKATKDSTDGISKLSDMDAMFEIAKGGGIVHLNSGDYQIDYKSNSPGFSRGLDYVPYDDYVVKAHKGEAIISANAADKLRKIDANFFNDTSNVVNALKEQTESIVDAVSGEVKFAPLTERNMPQTYQIKNQYA